AAGGRRGGAWGSGAGGGRDHGAAYTGRRRGRGLLRRRHRLRRGRLEPHRSLTPPPRRQLTSHRALSPHPRAEFPAGAHLSSTAHFPPTPHFLTVRLSTARPRSNSSTGR